MNKSRCSQHSQDQSGINTVHKFSWVSQVHVSNLHEVLKNGPVLAVLQIKSMVYLRSLLYGPDSFASNDAACSMGQLHMIYGSYFHLVTLR